LLTMTPFAVVAPIVGPLLDRWRGAYRFGIIASAAGRAVLAFMMASRVHRLVLYPLAFISLVLSRAHGVSRTALVPDAVPPNRSLMWANSRLSIISLLAATIAALPGAGIQKLFGAPWTLRLACVAFIAGTVVSFRLPKPSRDAEERRGGGHPHVLLEPRLLAAGA